VDGSEKEKTKKRVKTAGSWRSSGRSATMCVRLFFFGRLHFFFSVATLLWKF
jgi:hypothetical protein